MTMTAEDLGVLGDLATALGIMRNGSADPGWFGDPGERLATVLSDDHQRDALVSFLETVLDDGDVDTDDEGRTFVPLIKQTDPDVAVGIVLAPTPTTIDIGLRVDVATDAVTGAQARPGTTSSLEITLFRTARGDTPAPDPVLLLGQPGGRIRLQTRLDLDPSPPPPDEFHLGGIGVQVDVPTVASGDDPPAVSLTLAQLQLPGGSPQDFDLGIASAEELEQTVVELVLGLVRALAPNDSGPLNTVATLIGLTDDLPPLPIDQMLTDGVTAITAWLEDVLSNPTTRATWLAAIVDLLPAGAAVQGDAIAVDFGLATCLLRVRTEAGPSGRLRVVPSVDVEVGTAGARVRATLDVLEADLGTGASRALPRFGVWAELGRPDGTTEPLALDVPAAAPAPAVRVEAVRVGVALDAERLPTFVLAADRVRIGTHEYPTLDLTSTDALMDAAGAAVDEILDGILDSLGDVATTVRRLLGITPPPGHGLTAVSLPALAADPLGAVGEYWEQVVADADALGDHLAIIGEVLADAGAVGATVEGSGTAEDPWRVPLVAEAFELQRPPRGLRAARRHRSHHSGGDTRRRVHRRVRRSRHRDRHHRPRRRPRQPAHRSVRPPPAHRPRPDPRAGGHRRRAGAPRGRPRNHRRAVGPCGRRAVRARGAQPRRGRRRHPGAAATAAPGSAVRRRLVGRRRGVDRRVRAAGAGPVGEGRSVARLVGRRRRPEARAGGPRRSRRRSGRRGRGHGWRPSRWSSAMRSWAWSRIC